MSAKVETASPMLAAWIHSSGPGGRTRLVGTTHYTMAIYPELYWRGYAELLLHGIHTRVLRHIKRLTEDDRVGATATRPSSIGPTDELARRGTDEKGPLR